MSLRKVRPRRVWLLALALTFVVGGSLVAWYLSPLNRAPIYLESLGFDGSTAVRATIMADGSVVAHQIKGDVRADQSEPPRTLDVEAIYGLLD